MSRDKILLLSLWGLLFALSVIWFAQSSGSDVSSVSSSESPFRPSSPKTRINDAVSVTERARHIIERETVELDESRAVVRSLENAVKKEQEDFDSIRERTLRKTYDLQSLREQINQSILQEDSKVVIEALNVRFEEAARELQVLQTEMNEAYVKLQGLQEQVVAELVQDLP